MHEVGIMEGALDMARRLMEKRGGNRLRRVHMTIGSLSGVVPEALQSAFLALKDSYAAQDAALDVAWVEAVCRCDACRADFSFTEHGYICPGCGEPALAILRRAGTGADPCGVGMNSAPSGKNKGNLREHFPRTDGLIPLERIHRASNVKPTM